jgi:hypothetical protein
MKRGIKTWIVTSDKVQKMIGLLREELEDLLAEARAEHERQATASAQADADEQTAAATTAPAAHPTRGRAKRGARGKDSDGAPETTTSP